MRCTSSRSPSARSSPAEQAPPWLVDRIFRNLLVDATGNTHRTEFCIDKLFTPDAAVGPARPAGTARLRDAAALAHERGPAGAAARPGRQVLGPALRAHAERAGARACTTISCCRTSSGRISPTCWPISPRPATASRPTGSRRISSSASRKIGEVAQRGIELELRHALEPWHVLGEEPGGGGTVRYVDSARSSACRSRPSA